MHGKELPGRPDLVFKSMKKVIFVHGCFWHKHDCSRYKMPKSRKEFWLSKLESNMKRDNNTYSKLDDLGWEYLILWECQLKDKKNLSDRIVKFLG